MKKTLIALLVATFMIINCTKAQNGEMIFRDFEPDTFAYMHHVMHGGPGFSIDTLYLDINYDDINDLMFTWYQVSGDARSALWALNSVQYSLVLESQSYYLNDPDRLWSGGYQPIYHDEPKKVGVRFSKDGDYYYGWLLVYATTEPDTIFSPPSYYDRYIYVDKMAYCTIPNYPLLWGQETITGINENETETSSLKLYYDRNSDMLKILHPTDIKSVEIINYMGQVMLSEKNIEEIKLHAINSGVYIVRVQLSNNKIISEKFIK